MRARHLGTAADLRRRLGAAMDVASATLRHGGAPREHGECKVLAQSGGLGTWGTWRAGINMGIAICVYVPVVRYMSIYYSNPANTPVYSVE